MQLQQHLLLLLLLACVSGSSSSRVHVVFMNHLDVGYNGVPSVGYINNVLNQYFQVHFPQALKLIAQMRELGFSERFRYTTHPWLLDMYLNCPNLTLNNVTLKCPNATMLAAMEKAMVERDVLWHAGPMNMQLENMNTELLEASLNISLRLDKKYQPGKTLRVLSQRDVPGVTNQAILPLIRNNVAAITIGVNGGSYAPEVTREPFVWTDGTNEIIAIWHPGGYPNSPGDSPTNPGGLSVRDCSMVSGVPEVLCFSFRSDNQGPPQSPQEVLNTYEILRSEFPGVEIVASTLEDFVAAVRPYRSLMQIVRTEIGDTWIQGIASDPKKMADYRALSRAFTNCRRDGRCPDADSKVQEAVRYMIKPPEHTWGLPSQPDQVNYLNEKFRQARTGAAYVQNEKAWQEQRMFNSLSYTAAQGTQLQAYMDKELKGVLPVPASTDGLIREAFDPEDVHECGDFTFSFHEDGSFDRLERGGQTFANDIDRLAKFVYRSYDEVDDNKLLNSYGNPGYGKPNISKNADPISQAWPLLAVQQYRSQDKCTFVLVLQLKDKKAVTEYGAPQSVQVKYKFTKSQVDIETVMINKTSTRMEEAIFFEFRVSTEYQQQHQCKWWLNKIGGFADPLRVTYGGSVLQHAVNDRAMLQCKNSILQFVTLDVPLACPFNRYVEASPFPYLDRLAIVDGVSFNIYNNLWDTNYVFWYPYSQNDANFKARFAIKFSDI